MILKNLQSFIEIAKNRPRKKIAVAYAEDEQVLMAIKNAMYEGFAEPILVGTKNKIEALASTINFDLSGVDIINESEPSKAAKICVELIRDEKAQIIMKGLVSTADFLRAILDRERGLRKGDLLSHIGFFETPYYHKLIALTDAAQNIAPNFDEKVYIIKNSIDLFHRLGISTPKIAIISAVETINPKMESTIHAALLTAMNQRKQITGCLIDGPLAFDLAVSKEAAEHKGLKSEVAGDTDLILAPNIDVGNNLYKCMTYLGGATVAAIILGATVPIVLTSRADTERSKLMSLALAASC